MHKLIVFLEICSSFALCSKLLGPDKVHDKECGKVIACYYISSLSTGGVNIPQQLTGIDPHLCTHVFYKNVMISSEASIEFGDPYSDVDSTGYEKFKDLLKQNPKLKVLAAMGGYKEESTQAINNKALTASKQRKKLVDNIVNFVKKHGFNGVDIDFSPPPQPSTRPSDKKNFVVLLKELKKRFDKERLILSVLVDPNEATAKILYDIKGISTYVDFINLRTFEFHGNTHVEKKVGHTSPLYHASKENAKERKNNIDYVVKYWISQSASANKLILGTSFSGAAYTLANSKQFTRGSPISKKQSQYYGVATYSITCGLRKKWKYFYDKEQEVPYIYNQDQIIAYDDVHSMKKKAEYANKMHLRGVMVDLVNNDDVDGQCGKKFALLESLNEALGKKC